MTTTEANPPASPTASPPVRQALTDLELNAALAWSEPGAGPILHLAAALDISPRELLDIINRPHVIAFAEAARALNQQRADTLALHEHVAARQSLVRLAQNEQADPWLRLRAATAVLNSPSTPPRGAPTTSAARRSPAIPAGPRADRSDHPASAPTPPAETLRAAVRPHTPHHDTPTPTPTDIFTITIETIQRATPDNPESLAPIKDLCALPLRDTTITDFLARTQLHRAAGAQLSHHALLDHAAAPTLRATFDTTQGPLTFDFTCQSHGAATPTWRLTTITLVPHDAPEDEHSRNKGRRGADEPTALHEPQRLTAGHPP